MKREVDMQFVSGFLAIVSLCGLLAMMILMMYKKIPGGNLDMVKMSMIGLFGLCTTSFGYYMGSSQGSRLKTLMSNQQATPKPEPAPNPEPEPAEDPEPEPKPDEEVEPAPDDQRPKPPKE